VSDTFPPDLIEKVQEPDPVVAITFYYDPDSREHRARFLQQNGRVVMMTRDQHTGLWSLYGVSESLEADTYTPMEGAFDVTGAIESFFNGDLTFGIYRGEEDGD